MPGEKDCISVKKNGLKMHIQKRLLLNNLNELHSFFKEHNPSVNIGFSKFAQLRPEECILVGASGTHSLCVCHTSKCEITTCWCETPKLAPCIL